MTIWDIMSGRDLPARLERKTALARAAIMAERLWLALWPLLMTAGLFALYVMTGLAAWLPGWARMALAVAFFLVFLWNARHLARLKWPDREEALRRIEQRTGLAHHPLSAWTDDLAAPADDPRAITLWRAHRKRLAASLRNLRAGPPRSPLPLRDPFALRNGLALALIAALLLGGAANFSRQLRVSLSPSAPAAAGRTLDAWLTPPAYTGKPPVVLSSPAGESASGKGQIIAPQGSKLVLRLSGGSAPALELYALEPSGGAGRLLSKTAFIRDGEEDEAAFKLEKPLQRPAIAIVRDGGTLARWAFAILPDNAPTAALTRPPAHTYSGGLVLAWRASDDYGVGKLKAVFALSGKPAREPGEKPPLQFKPPVFSIPLDRLNPKKAAGKYTADTAAHPWAGLDVVMHLEATDQAGQTGKSKGYRFRLPGRVFRKPLARALIEQRRDLVMHPSKAPAIAATLAAFLAWPEGVADESGTYLGLRHAAWRLHEARTDAQLKDIVALLWALAVSIEDGDLSDSMKQLQAARKALEKALENGASDEEIARLTQKLREAMNRYLRDMARRMQKEGPGKNQSPGQSQGREISPKDLQKMLDRIENMAKTGSRGAARQMLSELDNMLRNLRPRMGRSGPPSAQEQALNELQELMREQQKLMDETWRAKPGKQGRPRYQGRDGREGDKRDGSRDRGGQQQNRESASGGKMGELARRQRQLEGRLNDLMRRMENRGAQAPQGLKKSGKAMKGASGALGRGDRGKALGKQGEALRAMREGAQKLARQVARQRGRGGRMGRFGRAGQGNDPLGRPMRDYGESRGPDGDMLPAESAVERARRILQALRKRANTPGRPKTELDYIDRLLKGLY